MEDEGGGQNGGRGCDRGMTLTTIKTFDIGYNLFMCLLLDKTNQLIYSYYVCLHTDHKVKRPN